MDTGRFSARGRRHQEGDPGRRPRKETQVDGRQRGESTETREEAREQFGAGCVLRRDEEGSVNYFGLMVLTTLEGQCVPGPGAKLPINAQKKVRTTTSGLQLSQVSQLPTWLLRYDFEVRKQVPS